MKRVIALILMAAICLCLLSGCGFFGIRLFGGPRYGHAGKYAAGGGTVEGTVQNLEIDWASGSVAVQYHDGDKVLVEETATGRLSKDEQAHWWLDDGTLHVKYAASSPVISFLPRLVTPTKSLVIWLPKGADLTLLGIDTASASVLIDDVTAGEIDVDTASGAVDITDVTADCVDIDTVSGDVDVTLPGKTETIKIDTKSGAITAVAEDLTRFSADSVSGNVTLACGKAPKDLEADTVSGSVTLYLPADAGYTLDYDTVSGRFQSDIPFAAGKDTYTFGSGEHKYSVDTTSGDLTVEALESVAEWY